MLVKQLSIKRPGYNADLWRKLRLLYRGVQLGERLRNDETLREQIFPKHGAEEDFVYSERFHRLHYINYLALVLDALVAQATAEPITAVFPQGMDPFWPQWVEDVTGAGLHEKPLCALAAEVLRDALRDQEAWLLADLPVVKGAEKITSLAEQDKAGARRAYLITLLPEQVIDYECDEGGNFRWALIHSCRNVRENLEDDRSTVVEEWAYWTPTEVRRFELKHKADKPPQDSDEVTEVGSTPHTFGRVPLLCFRLPENLWFGAKAETLVTELLNKSNALTWAEYTTLFQTLVVQQDPNVIPTDPLAENSDRFKGQALGPGRYITMAKDDKLSYLGPDPAPFASALESIKSFRIEMLRVLHSMSLSLDQTGAAMARSEGSRVLDREDNYVLCHHLAGLLVQFVRQLVRLVGHVRGEEVGDKGIEITGGPRIEKTPLATVLENALKVGDLEIPSRTFHGLHKARVAVEVLDELAIETTPAQRKQIEDEITAGVNMEEVINSLDKSEPSEDEDETTEPDAPAKPEYPRE